LILRNIVYGFFLSVVTIAPAGIAHAQADPRSTSYDQDAPSSIANAEQNIGKTGTNATDAYGSTGSPNDDAYTDDGYASDSEATDENAPDGYSTESDATRNYRPDNYPLAAATGNAARGVGRNYASGPGPAGSSNKYASGPGAAGSGKLSSDLAALSADDSDSSRPTIIRVQVLLDRAHFSPGEIDGKLGSSLRSAIVAYRQARGLGDSSAIDDALLKSLNANNSGTILQRYTITDTDEKGPFIGKVSEDFRKLAKLKCTCYGDVEEELAEKFHMSPNLLDELNPDADFTATGESIVVARLTNTPLPAVSRIEVDKSAHRVRAFDQFGDLVAVFPATVGSDELPSPSGTAKVVYVRRNPVYHYDPKALHFGPKNAGSFNIAPGPNNPVGTTWMALDRPGYGIHGTPNPRLIGKTQSHGCVRLTNWDANTLGKAVGPGTIVDFVGDTATRVASRD
jgi:lipoprotein-anchoring transpeptidase ErfK/SrfK